MKLAHRLLLGAVLVVTVLIVVLVALSSVRMSRRLEDLEIAQLTREAQLIAREWTPAIDADALASDAGAAIGHRVTLIDSTGHVIGDSEFHGDARERLENHRTRPEVVAAVRDGVGSADRRSPSEGDNELYVAVRSRYGVTRVSISTASLDAIVARGRRDVLISGFVALLAALVLAAAFSRAVSRPVVELRDVARALASGDLSRRPALSAPGEVGDLAAAVHRMAEQLASRLKALEDDDMHMSAVIESLQEGVIAVDARRQIVRVNESGRRMLRLTEPVPFPADRLPRDRTLRESLAAALAGESTEPTEIAVDGQSMMLTARALGDGGAVLAVFDLTATRRVEAVRRDFVANVSHELKTPLTVILGFAETLAAGDVPAEQSHRFAEAIQTNARRMQQIVDDLLDLSRIESGGWVPNPVAVDLRTIASEVSLGRQPSALAKDVRLTVDIAPDAECAFADPTAVRQVYANLVDNAIRHTGEGGSIILFSERAEGGTTIGVRDTGTGIAQEHLSRIFERFYRADMGRARDSGGTGLGLAIVRHLVEAHRGRTSVESALGKGTTVRALFPNLTT